MPPSRLLDQHEVADEGEVIGGLSGEIGMARKDVVRVEIASEEETIEGAERQGGGEGADAAGGGQEAGGLEHPLAERAPDIVVVAADDHGRLAVMASERFMVEEPQELQLAFVAGEAEMNVGQHDRTSVVLPAQVDARHEGLSTLFERKREIDAAEDFNRKATEDGVAVATDLQPDILLMRSVFEAERVGK